MSTQRPPNVSMALAARPENVTLVREVLGGLAEVVDFGAELEDVRAAVSEAANNVVIHAYDGAEGSLEVELTLSPHELHALVRDHGCGRARREADDGDAVAHGIGLTVIEALSTRTQLRASPGRGTEVAMWFEIAADCAPAPPSDPPPPAAPSGEEVRIVVAPASLSGAIISRLVGAMAARAGFSIDRLADAQLVSDALAAAAAGEQDHVSVAIDVPAARLLSLSLDGLPPGRAAALLAASALRDIGPLVERLSDEIEVLSGPGGETLQILLRDRRQSA